jgi:hypothetical protein
MSLTSTYGSTSLESVEIPRRGERFVPEYEKAMRPEDITRLFVERSNAGDAAGVAALYEEDAVLAYPPGGRTVGREAIHALW